MKRAKQDWSTLLREPAKEVAVQLLQAKQRYVEESWDHYVAAGGTDLEALHDLRVDVRRLRVWLKVAKPLVSTRHSVRVSLKELAHASNPVRDHEVMVALLEHGAEDENLVEAASWLLDYYDREELSTARVDFDPKKDLAPKPRKGNKQCFGDWLADQVVDILTRVEVELGQGEEQLHQARIEIKHLRYLIEPVHLLPAAEALLPLLKRLQTSLGDIHDIVVFRQHLPLFTQWFLDAELSPLLTTHEGKQARPIQQVFGRVRDRILKLTAWQTEQQQALIKHWREEELDMSRDLSTHIQALVAQLRPQEA